MSRMVDRIIANGFDAPYWTGIDRAEPTFREFEQQTRRSLSTCHVIVADNVAEYLYAGTDQEDWKLGKDFPNIAPPFPVFFVENRRPSRIVSEKHGEHDSLPELRCWGALMEAIRVDHIDSPKVPSPFNGRPMNTTGAKWFMRGMVFMESRETQRIFGPICQTLVAIGPEGEALDDPVIGAVVTEFSPITKQHVSTMASFFFPTFLAISFTHCKNVTLINNDERTTGHGKKWLKNKGHRLRKFYTLDIEPMRTILRRDGRAEAVGLRKALHIVRGHFRDYRQHGLFGRNFGIYWFDSHVRGSSENGKAEKDYRVRV